MSYAGTKMTATVVFNVSGINICCTMVTEVFIVNVKMNWQCVIVLSAMW